MIFSDLFILVISDKVLFFKRLLCSNQQKYYLTNVKYHVFKIYLRNI